MDEMKLSLSTKFMRGLIAKIIRKMIFKQVGYQVEINLNELEVSYIDGKAHVHTSVDLSMENEEFMKLIKSVTNFD